MGAQGSAAKEREPNACKICKVSRPLKGSTPPKAIVDTRWALTWVMVDSKKGARGRLFALGYQGPGPKAGSVDASGCVSLRSFYLQAISLEYL